MTKNTIFFMINKNLKVIGRDTVLQYMGMDYTREIRLNIYLLHSLSYPNPLMYVTIYDTDGNFKFTYIDLIKCKYVQPVIYDSGIIDDKINHLNNIELDMLDYCMTIPSSIYGSTYREMLGRHIKFKKESKDKWKEIRCNYNKIDLNDYHRIPEFKSFLKEETR